MVRRRTRFSFRQPRSCSQSSYLFSQLAPKGCAVVVVVNVHQAKTQLSRLLAQVEAGEDVVIARRGKPVARLVGCKRRNKRQADLLKGKLSVPDRFFDPLPEDELAAWDGR